MVRPISCRARRMCRLGGFTLGILLAFSEGALACPLPLSLVDTAWRLVAIESMDDATATTRPADPSRYTLQLKADGTASLRLDCNSANAQWMASESRDAKSGSLRFGPIAMTRALCPPPSLSEAVGRQATDVRSYLLRDGRLYLSLMTDGGILVWEPAQSADRT